MVGISDLLGNVKTLVGKYHYSKAQSDAKYVILDDLNSAIEAELTPPNPSVTVNIVNTSSYTDNLNAYLISSNDYQGYITSETPTAISNGAATFNNVTSGDYVLLITKASDYEAIVGARKITVSNTSLTESFTLRNITISDIAYDTNNSTPMETPGMLSFSDAYIDSNYDVSVDITAGILAYGTYYAQIGSMFYDRNSPTSMDSVTIDASNGEIISYHEEYQSDNPDDPMEP